MKKLEKEVEEWLDKRYLKDMGVRKPCREAYLAAAKHREKQIEVLKKENVDLKKKNTAIRQDWDVMKSTIADYEKENEELTKN